MIKKVNFDIDIHLKIKIDFFNKFIKINKYSSGERMDIYFQKLKDHGLDKILEQNNIQLKTFFLNQLYVLYVEQGKINKVFEILKELNDNKINEEFYNLIIDQK